MNQKISPVSYEMLQYVEEKRGWVKNHYTSETIHEYDTIEGKLKLLDVIIKSNWIKKDETAKLQSLGVTFGDILVQEMGFKWITVDDEYGTDAALQLGNTSLILFPLTMISKRIEKDEEVDVYYLLDKLKEKVEEIKDES